MQFAQPGIALIKIQRDAQVTQRLVQGVPGDGFFSLRFQVSYTLGSLLLLDLLLHLAQQFAGSHILPVDFQQLQQLFSALVPLPIGNGLFHDFQVHRDPLALETLLEVGKIESQFGRSLVTIVRLFRQYPLQNSVQLRRILPQEVT